MALYFCNRLLAINLLWSYASIAYVACASGGQVKEFMKIWNRQQAAIRPEALAYRNFTCSRHRIDTRNEPENIHMVRPENIGVIAALGDSITAGSGAGASSRNDIFSSRYRSLSFSVGGEESLDTVTTLPNILRLFNPKLYGAALATDARLNTAVPGSRARDMPAQANELVRRLKSRPHLADLWKVVTVFIGINDICHACYTDPETFRVAPSLWIRDIERAVNILYTSLTKTFVNVVSMSSVWQLRQFEKYEACASSLSGCRCISSSFSYYKSTDLVNKKYQTAVNDFVSKYDRSDFTVVVQPFLTTFVFKISSGRTMSDVSFISPDCFHFSQRWHAAAASGLWNNMLQPVGSKSNKTNSSAVSLRCPDAECPYLRTHLNSINCTKSYLTSLERRLPLDAVDIKIDVEEEEKTEPEGKGATGRSALWIFLILLTIALVGGGGFYWHRRRNRRGKMNLAQLSGQYTEDPQVPLVSVNDLRQQNARFVT